MHVDTHILESNACIARNTLSEEFSDLRDDGLDDVLEDRILRWMLESQNELNRRFPFAQQQYDYENCYADYLKKRTTVESLCEDIRKCEAFSESARKFWIDECAGADTERLLTIQKSIIDTWKNHLDTKVTEWSLKVLEKKRMEFIDSMETWLRFIESAKYALESMGVGNGMLWDLSPGRDDHEDHSELLKWAGRFRDDPVLRKLCDMLGHEVVASRTSEGTAETPQSFSTQVPDHTVSEEFSGIETGNRIEDLLPSELGLIDDDELKTLFDLKFAENRLTCFSKQGYAAIESEETVIQNVEKDDDGFSGPVILCVDTSGSMTGTPEYIAKSVALFIAMKAHSEGRRCYIINFSTAIDTLDLSSGGNIQELLEFLEKSFHGGTDIGPALIEALNKIDSEEYRKADVLTVSDFIIPPDGLDFMKKEISAGKERRCRFHSLTIGNFQFAPKVADFFDVAWQFNPATHSISKIE